MGERFVSMPFSFLFSGPKGRSFGRRRWKKPPRRYLQPCPELVGAIASITEAVSSEVADLDPLLAEIEAGVETSVATVVDQASSIDVDLVVAEQELVTDVTVDVAQSVDLDGLVASDASIQLDHLVTQSDLVTDVDARVVEDDSSEREESLTDESSTDQSESEQPASDQPDGSLDEPEPNVVSEPAVEDTPVVVSDPVVPTDPVVVTDPVVGD